MHSKYMWFFFTLTKFSKAGKKLGKLLLTCDVDELEALDQNV